MKKEKISIAIVGATGLVGTTFIKILEERNFPLDKLTLFASEKSQDTILIFRGEHYEIKVINEQSFEGIDIALLSAGGNVAMKYAPIAAKSGCIVIDNSSAWRQHNKVPLIVPEVNPEVIVNHSGIISNPNCSTIQLVVALKPLQDAFGIRRVVVSTYQSITGAGFKGIHQLERELANKPIVNPVTKHPIANNTFFHPITDPAGFSIEEIKMRNETRKILGKADLPIAVTCVRLPIIGGHGESVNIEFEKDCTVEEIKEVLTNQEGIILVDDPQNEVYPTIRKAQDTDFVYVGRVRKDESVANGAYLWIVADNVRKGAATNAVQIAEIIVEKGWFDFQYSAF